MPAFAAAVTCIDGRFHPPLVAWIHATFGVDHVDLVTSPGVGAALADQHPTVLTSVTAHLQPSVHAHHAGVVVVAAHADCAADPSPDEVQRAALPRARGHLVEHLGVHAPSVVAVHLDAAGAITIVADPDGVVGRTVPWRVRASHEPEPTYRQRSM